MSVPLLPSPKPSVSPFNGLRQFLLRRTPYVAAAPHLRIPALPPQQKPAPHEQTLAELYHLALAVTEEHGLD
jgi:hypothetical protein